MNIATDTHASVPTKVDDINKLDQVDKENSTPASPLSQRSWAAPRPALKPRASKSRLPSQPSRPRSFEPWGTHANFMSPPPPAKLSRSPARGVLVNLTKTPPRASYAEKVKGIFAGHRRSQSGNNFDPGMPCARREGNADDSRNLITLPDGSKARVIKTDKRIFLQSVDGGDTRRSSGVGGDGSRIMSGATVQTSERENSLTTESRVTLRHHDAQSNGPDPEPRKVELTQGLEEPTLYELGVSSHLTAAEPVEDVSSQATILDSTVVAEDTTPPSSPIRRSSERGEASRGQVMKSRRRPELNSASLLPPKGHASKRKVVKDRHCIALDLPSIPPHESLDIPSEPVSNGPFVPTHDHSSPSKFPVQQHTRAFRNEARFPGPLSSWLPIDGEFAKAWGSPRPPSATLESEERSCEVQRTPGPPSAIIESKKDVTQVEKLTQPRTSIFAPNGESARAKEAKPRSSAIPSSNREPERTSKTAVTSKQQTETIKAKQSFKDLVKQSSAGSLLLSPPWQVSMASNQVASCPEDVEHNQNQDLPQHNQSQRIDLAPLAAAQSSSPQHNQASDPNNKPAVTNPASPYIDDDHYNDSDSSDAWTDDSQFLPSYALRRKKREARRQLQRRRLHSQQEPCSKREQSPIEKIARTTVRIGCVDVPVSPRPSRFTAPMRTFVKSEQDVEKFVDSSPQGVSSKVAPGQLDGFVEGVGERHNVRMRLPPAYRASDADDEDSGFNA